MFARAKGHALAVVVAGSALLVGAARVSGDDQDVAATPIKHLVVIFQENVSFDHYFATYPR